MIIMRRFVIAAAHRLIAHPGKCKNYHGHTYRFDVAIEGTVSSEGMVCDFGLVKDLIGTWLDENWDHGMILQSGDPLIQPLKELGSKVYELSQPPTAENMAAYLAARFPVVSEVSCFETDSCSATYRK